MGGYFKIMRGFAIKLWSLLLQHTNKWLNGRFRITMLVLISATLVLTGTSYIYYYWYEESNQERISSKDQQVSSAKLEQTKSLFSWLMFGRESTYQNKKHTQWPARYKTCKPVNDIVFIKVHKAGSTSAMNIFLRYGLHNKLVFALPKGRHYFNHLPYFDTNIILPPPKGKRFNILCNHSVYNRTVIRRLFPPWTFYVGIVRQPFHQFVSAFNYFSIARQVRKFKKDSKNPIRDYLKSPEKLKIPNSINFLNNRMSFDLGFPRNYVKNKTAISDYIKLLDKDFNFIMIMEYFEESLILLRRRLCWSMKDIISVKLNSGRYNLTETTMEDYERHKNMSLADYMLYEHYLNVFWKLVAAEGPSFFKELNHYKQVQKLIKDFCEIKSNSTKIDIPKSEWNVAFHTTREDCRLITIEELKFVKIIRDAQNLL